MTPAILHRLSTREGRRRGSRLLLGVCAAGFAVSGVVFGWDRWFFLLMLWVGVVYIPLRLALEWLGAAGQRQRQRYRAVLPDRITPQNLPVAAQALYDKYGFRRVGLRPRYYSDNLEDAYVMALEGLDTPAVARRLAELRGRYRERWGEADLQVGV